MTKTKIYKAEHIGSLYRIVKTKGGYYVETSPMMESGKSANQWGVIGGSVGLPEGFFKKKSTAIRFIKTATKVGVGEERFWAILERMEGK